MKTTAQNTVTLVETLYDITFVGPSSKLGRIRAILSAKKWFPRRPSNKYSGLQVIS